MNIYGMDPTIARLLGLDDFAAGAPAPRSAPLAMPLGPLPAWQTNRHAPQLDPSIHDGLMHAARDVGSLLDDPSLSLVDKLILLMGSVDKNMQRKANAKMKQIQAAGAQDGGGEGGSLDVQSIELKRIIDTASQIKDIIRGAIDKQTDSENKSAQAVGR
jgi:hypothetical protein